MTTRMVGDVTVLDVNDRLVLETRARFHDEIDRITASGCPKLVVNLAEVDYMDSAGLGELIKAYGALQRLGGAVKLLNVTPHVRRLLELTRLAAIFEAYRSEREAVESFDIATHRPV